MNAYSPQFIPAKNTCAKAACEERGMDVVMSNLDYQDLAWQMIREDLYPRVQTGVIDTPFGPLTAGAIRPCIQN